MPLNTSTTGSATGNPRNKVALRPGHSLMDWIRLGNSGADLAGTSGAFLDVTPAQLAEHKYPGDVWICIRGIVYNISKYLDFHPGGVGELMKGAGIDATSLFNQVHPWVNYESILKKCVVGIMRVPIDEDVFQFSQTSHIRDIDNKPEIIKNPIVSKVDWYQQLTFLTFVFYLSKPTDQVAVDNRVKTEMWISIGNFWTGWESKSALAWPPQVTVTDCKVEIKFSKTVSSEWDHLEKLLSPPPNMDSWKLAFDSISQINHNVFLISLKAHERVYHYVPVGHHLTLTANIKGLRVERSYTPVKKVSGTELANTHFVWLLVKKYKDGIFSSWLTGPHPGEVLLISSPPIGTFDIQIFKSTFTRLTLLAAGTGLTPMLGLTSWALKNSKLKVSLKFFNKTEQDIIWRDILNELDSKDKRFTVEHILSDANSHWRGKRGWITLQMLQSFIPDFSHDVPALDFICICGPISFTQLCERYLQDMSYPANHYFCFKG